jgi:hypothetical protein
MNNDLELNKSETRMEQMRKVKKIREEGKKKEK